MARVPTYPYRVTVYSRTNNVDGRASKGENHNYESLPGAWAYRDIALRRHLTSKVEVWLCLDESTPSHPTGG